MSVLAKVSKNTNEKCPICLEDYDEDLYVLVCTHRVHLECISHITNFECPLCRVPPINLPANIRRKIEENGKKYREEQIDEERAQILEMIEREQDYNNSVRLPPQIELILALKYVFELGIPVSLIPTDITLEIDPHSPLPAPGSIFQNGVRKIIETIQNRNELNVSEDDLELECEFEGEENDCSENEDFDFEGEDLQIVHRVRTIPYSRGRNTGEYGRNLTLFNTMTFQISQLPPLTEEDLQNLGL